MSAHSELRHNCIVQVHWITSSMMWLLSLHLALAITIGALDSQSSPLPGPSSSQCSYDGLINILPTVSSRSDNLQFEEATAVPTPEDFLPSLPDHHYFSTPVQPDNPTNTVLPSTNTAFSVMPTSTVKRMSQTIPTLSTNLPVIVPPSLVAELICYHEDSYSCQASSPLGCRCDAQCKLFGDCCSDSVYVHNTNIPNFDCQPNIVLPERNSIYEESALKYYWMIASCPNSKTDSTNELADMCEAQSLPSPPISDNRTGLVYRNKYCAQCHSVPEEEQISWQSEWRCNGSLLERANSSGGIVDLDVLLAACYATVYIEPQWTGARAYPLRECDFGITYKCQPPPGTNTSSKEYRDLDERCHGEPGKAREISSAPGTYKNEYCALCSSPTMDRSELQCPPDLVPPSSNVKISGITVPPLNTFTLLLDVTGSGLIVLSTHNIHVSKTIKESCAKMQVFDVYSSVCREALCLPGYTYNGTACLPSDSNCTLIALNATEYDSLNNQNIFWIALEQNVSVQGYTSEGNPLVCANFTSDFNTTVNETITRPLYGYPPAFAILSYLGLSVDVVAAAILLFTYAVFAEMRTFYGKLFMNFVLVLLLGDLTFLLGSAVYAVSLEDVVCQVVAILLHYLFLARFVWMSLLSLNVARHFYHAMKLVVSEERESWHYLILYMAAGWLSPLLVLTVTVPVNYAIPGAVGYGVEGLCWMNQTLAIVVSFIVPIAICILFTTGAFVFVCIILAKWHSSNVEIDKKHKTGSRNFRVLIAVFSITGATWVFGFLALIGSALSWVWYLFIIFNTTQAVFVMLAYVCTAKVLRLYRTLLKRVFPSCVGRCRRHFKSHVSEQQTQLELIKQSMSNTTGTLASSQASSGNTNV